MHLSVSMKKATRELSGENLKSETFPVVLNLTAVLEKKLKCLRDLICDFRLNHKKERLHFFFYNVTLQMSCEGLKPNFCFFTGLVFGRKNVKEKNPYFDQCLFSLMSHAEPLGHQAGQSMAVPYVCC